MISVEILDVEYSCDHEVVFPKVVQVNNPTKEEVMIALEDLAEIDCNDYATAEVTDVEFEVIT